MIRSTGAWKMLAVVLIASMLLAACSPGGGQGDKGTILIGGALCLTGIQASLDEPAVRGAQLAVDELNKKGGILGRKVEFVNLDGKSDPASVGSAAANLVSKGAKAIIAPSDYDFGGPASREAQKAGIIGISPAASSPLYSSASLGDKQFTMSMWNTTMGAATAEFAFKTKGWKVGYVVTDTFIDYTKSLSRYFIIQFKALGGTILYEDSYTQGAQDFTSQLDRLKSQTQQPDFIFISSYMPDLATMIRTIREAGITIPVIGGDSYDDPSLFKALGEQYGSDIYFDTHGFLTPDATPEMPAFLTTYKAKYNSDADAVWVATGWDAVMVIAQAMEKAGTTDGAAVAKAMESMQFSLLTGKLKWSGADQGHEPDIEAAMVQLDKGTPRFLGWVRPSSIPTP